MHSPRNEPRRTDLDRKCDPRTPRPPLDEAAKQLVGRHLGLANKLAGLYQRRVPGLREDLAQDALMGLCEAATTWDPDDGAPFPMFARIRILGALKDAIRSEARGGLKGGKELPNRYQIGVDLAAPEDVADDGDCFDRLTAPLTDRQRAVCTALFVCGLTRAEAAERVGVKPKDVPEYVKRSVKAIRSRLTV